LEKVIEEKVKKGDTSGLKPHPKPKPTNVIDLVSVLQESLDKSGGKKKAKPASQKDGKPRRKAA